MLGSLDVEQTGDDSCTCVLELLVADNPRSVDAIVTQFLGLKHSVDQGVSTTDLNNRLLNLQVNSYRA